MRGSVPKSGLTQTDFALNLGTSIDTPDMAQSHRGAQGRGGGCPDEGQGRDSRAAPAGQGRRGGETVTGVRKPVCMDVLRVDCASCRVRGTGCSDCVMSVLLGPVDEAVELDTDEVSALQAMAHSGLLPPLRLIRGAALAAPRDPEDWPGFAIDQAFP